MCFNRNHWDITFTPVPCPLFGLPSGFTDRFSLHGKVHSYVTDVSILTSFITIITVTDVTNVSNVTPVKTATTLTTVTDVTVSPITSVSCWEGSGLFT